MDKDYAAVTMAKALMKGYQFTRDHLTKCLFCDQPIDLDCDIECPMVVAEQVLIDAGIDPLAKVLEGEGS